jgi:adenine-specific DNA methylase
MTQQYPKRLIEVDLPIKRISAHARREKSIRHGHISTLHIWWARRPLAACRAVTCAALWPDPADPLCPQDFRDKASELITDFAKAAVTDRALGESCDHETWVKWQALVKNGGLDGRNQTHWNVLRFALLDFIADFANWDNTTNKVYIKTSRALTLAAHEALGGEHGSRPILVDPFAGGGSIPLEALRIGADVFASDLNPVAVLLNRVVIEYIPKFGERLSREVVKWGTWLRAEAEKDLSRFYPRSDEREDLLAYLWARTITCEGPGCGAILPLIRSLWLGKKPHNSWALKITPQKGDKVIEIGTERNPVHVAGGTVRKGAATCPLCGYTTPVEGVRTQLYRRRGGTDDARLIAVATTRQGEKGRFYRVPTQADHDAVSALRAHVAKQSSDEFLNPSESLPPQGTLGFRIQLYGLTTWGNVFFARQRLALATLATLIQKVGNELRKSASEDFALAVQEVLSLGVGKLADYGSSLCTWMPQASQETVAHTFSRQALPMVWDFAEAYPFASSSGGWEHGLAFSVSPLNAESHSCLPSGRIEAASATEHPFPDDSVSAVVTDPPYYDAVPYADLSDYFLVWLKRALKGSPSPLCQYVLSPKDQECVAHESKGRGREFFEACMCQALKECRRIIKPDGVGVVVFAHKSTRGWETQIQAMITAGWVVTGSWPIDTERGARLRAIDSAALASSIHLVCRPRDAVVGLADDRNVGDWRDVLQELPQRIHDWMPRLADEGVVGADAIFACLGPALEVFSRYSRVEKANGAPVSLKEYLEHVWATVAKEALAMVFKGADTTGFEPDARLTAMWLWTLISPELSERIEEGVGIEESDSANEPEGKKAKAGFTLEYDAARKIAQGLGANLETLDHLVEMSGDQARLLPVSERVRHLFGKEEEEPVSARAKRKKSNQLDMFAELTEAEDTEIAWREKTVKRIGETTLDRVHQSMILFAAGRGEALKRFVVEDGIGQDGRFWRLAQALSALYPAGSDEKRWVDGVLARKKQFGF